MDSSLPNVYELAQRRLKFLFEAFDNIYVSFSGGKDSSVLLNLCIDYIRRHGLDRKIGVFHMDYEIQYRDTVAHVDQVLASNADILEVYRVCVPFKVPTCTSMIFANFACESPVIALTSFTRNASTWNSRDGARSPRVISPICCMLSASCAKRCLSIMPTRL